MRFTQVWTSLKAQSASKDTIGYCISAEVKHILNAVAHCFSTAESELAFGPFLDNRPLWTKYQLILAKVLYDLLFFLKKLTDIHRSSVQLNQITLTITIIYNEIISLWCQTTPLTNIIIKIIVIFIIELLNKVNLNLAPILRYLYMFMLNDENITFLLG